MISAEKIYENFNKICQILRFPIYVVMKKRYQLIIPVWISIRDHAIKICIKQLSRVQTRANMDRNNRKLQTNDTKDRGRRNDTGYDTKFASHDIAPFYRSPIV